MDFRFPPFSFSLPRNGGRKQRAPVNYRMLIKWKRDRLIAGRRRKKFAQKWNERSVTADNRWPVSGFAANLRIGARFIAGPAVLSNNTNYSYVNNEPGIISIPPPPRPIQFAVTIP